MHSAPINYSVNDPDFGPAIMIGPGGIFIELMPERAVLMAPFDQKTVRRAILGLRIANQTCDRDVCVMNT